jgi:C-terminal processing protease CtpA/Prc
MKSASRYLVPALAFCILWGQPASAQMTTDQRLQDFQNLEALFAKRYAPADWKKLAFNFDVFNISPWLDRVRAAKDDLEFFEIEAEYVANLQDTHTGFQTSSSFVARLGAAPFSGGGVLIGMFVDIYDGKVLIDLINRSTLPTATYPFQIGDELVSVDGVSAEDWITRLSTWRRYGNPATTRRFASQAIVTRAQSTFPRAVETGDSAVIQVRRASGALENYTIPWFKTGYPLTKVGPVPSPHIVEPRLAQPDYLQALDELHNYKLPDNDPLNYFVSLGARSPQFVGGFPSTFIQRLGKTVSDFHYSGTYTSGGLTIGFLRIPSFAPPSTALAELRAEIDYMQKNTDGLVVDVTRNPGGGCYMIDVAATLIPYPFYFFGEQLRATEDRLNTFESLLEIAKSSGAAPGVIATYQQYLDQVKAAYTANRGMTNPIPSCNQTNSTGAPISFNNQPASTVYTKPMIVLIDELSISAADIFPSMIQDNGRALLVGDRSSGGGGSVSGWYTGFYSESYSTNTNSLVVRKNPITTPEYPTAPYVENIGARPDVPLESMTRENLLNGGRTYVTGFTQILINQIQAAAAQTTFSIPDRGALSWTTLPGSGAPITGYGRIQANGSTTPSGLAIFGINQNGVLVSEAAVPATAAIQSGRIYAEISSSVDTGIAIANPNFFPVTVSFNFTGPKGDFGAGSVVIPANGQIASYLDQPPFNGVTPSVGTFTFSSSSKIAAVALRSFTNERAETLLTTLPVVNLAALPAADSVPVAPHFADGGGWQTEVILVNPTDSLLTGTVVFKDQYGAALNLQVAVQPAGSGSILSYSIPPRASQKFTTPGIALVPGPVDVIRTGSVTITPATGTVPPVGAVVFSFRPNGITVTQAGVPAAGAAKAYRLYGEASGNFDTAAPGSMQTGIAIYNRATTSATVVVELFRLDGSSTGLTGALVVAGSGQAATYLNRIPGLESMPSPFQGVVRVSNSSPISVIGLRGHFNERGELLTTTTPSVDESATPTDAEMYFPHVVKGGSFTTQVILFSGSAGQQSTGDVRFASQSGDIMKLP